MSKRKPWWKQVEFHFVPESIGHTWWKDQPCPMCAEWLRLKSG